MIASGSRIRQIGWAAVLVVCVALFALLSLQVQTVRSEVLLAEREIISLERDVLMLETEFQTRASQRQLAEWNTIELGYKAPRADQYLESNRQLASLGQDDRPDAPAPIRVARAELSAADMGPKDMRSPVTGEPVTLASANAGEDAGAIFADAFGEFLTDASPIRPANAQTPASGGADPAVLLSEVSQ
ncbi:MAG: hypothetical protein ABJ205_04050 [Erythrobacter sp.]|uniref:hypothetical protein n=1 Tax=Erythrobacter sp. TaxID=1042 RepID=UPI0032676FD4